MSNSRCQECDAKNSCAYFVAVPGGDSLLCKPYRKEQFYHIGYSSSVSSSCSSLQAIYCKETINTLSAIVYEESDSCTCHIPACFACPRHQHVPQIYSTASCTECNSRSYICDQPKNLKLRPDICRLAELVDVSSSVSDLLAKFKESKAQTEAKKNKDRRKHKCECRPIQNICLKTVVKKSSCGQCSVKEIKSSSSQSNEDEITCSPCKRKVKLEFQSPTCVEEANVCPGNVEKDVNINLLVNVKKEKECAPVRQRKKCKCKDKKKTETKKVCKCHICPPIVICDKKPERNKTFLQTIKAMIPSPTKNDKEQTTRCACKKENGKNEIYAVTLCTNDKGSHKHHEKPLEHHSVPKPNHNKSNSHHRHSNKHIEAVTKTGEHSNKHKQESFHSRDHHHTKNTARPETEIKPPHNQQTEHNAKPQMEIKRSLKPARKSQELNTIYLNNNSVSRDRSVFINPEEKTVHYMFLETYERYPLRIAYNELQDVTYNVKLSYKSILWLGLGNFNDVLKFRKPSTDTVQTKWEPLETSGSFTEMNTNDKFSQDTGIVEQYRDNDKNFLSIVKKFEEYKNQQRVLGDMKRRMSNSCRKGPVENFVMRRVIRGKRRVLFTKIKCDYLCRIFCDYIGPLIYFFYLVVFFWVTF